MFTLDTHQQDVSVLIYKMWQYIDNKGLRLEEQNAFEVIDSHWCSVERTL